MKRKPRYAAEKAAIDESLANGHGLLNNPPSEPYLVDTDVPIEGTILDTVPVIDGRVFDFTVWTDIHVETACKLPAKVLSRLVCGIRRGKLEKWVNPCEFPHTTFNDFKYHVVDLTVVLDYPTDEPMAFIAHMKVKRFVDVGDLVWGICQAYRALYTDPKRYGIWGHALGDLVILEIELDTKNMILVPGIGS